MAPLCRVVKYTSHQLILIKMRLTLAARSLASFCLGTLATPSVYPVSCCHAVYLTPLLTGPAPPAHPPAFRVHSLFSYLTPLVSRVSLCLTAKNIKILLSRYYEATYVGRSFRATVFHPTARGRDGESSDEKRRRVNAVLEEFRTLRWLFIPGIFRICDRCF